MSSLHWQEQRPSKNTGSNVWFGVSMGLLGIIVGFIATSFLSGRIPTSGGTNTPPSQQVAQVPTAPTQQQAPTPQPAPGPLPPIDAKTDHIRGDLSKARVALIEYSDFECPFCIRHHPTMKQIVDTYGDDVVWVYRHFPLSFHVNAQKEAEASECANELGGNNVFWQYTDAIFTRTAGNGTGFPLANLTPLAKEFGLDEVKFKNCLDSGKYAKHVQDEEAAGKAAGVNGTPGNFIVNLKSQKNQMISGAQPFSAFKSAINTMLADGDTASAPNSASERKIKMTTELWKFTPDVIKIKQGERVILEVTAVSGTHGLSVPSLNIDETIIQGKTISIAVSTDKIGTFDFRCSVQCGSGHDGMTGQIIIES